MNRNDASLPLVYVLVLNWNGCHHLEACLPSLVETQYGNWCPVVVDNGSTDGSQTWVRENYPQVRLMDLGRNLGFTGANNAGMRMAITQGADYVVLLNNDTRVDPDWLWALVAAAEENQQIAICQAQQRTWDGRHEIRFEFIPEWTEGRGVKVPLQEPGPVEPRPYACGGEMFLRCDALQRIGLFDERYFIYNEDVDLSLRAWIFGYHVMLVPASVVYHQTHGTMSGSARRSFLGYRNGLTTTLKLYQRQTLRTFQHAIVARWLWTRNRIALRSTLANLARLPETLAERATIQRQRVMPDEVFLALC